MSFFRFRKLYADLVTADGTVCITYLAWVEAWGFRNAFAGLEIYSPSGQREILRALPPKAGPPAPQPDGVWDLRLDFGTSSLHIRYEPLCPSWTPEGVAPTPDLDWSAPVPRAAVIARWEGQPARPPLSGTGYMDWVELRRPTRWLGLRRLEWGRVHLPDSTYIFTGIRRAGGEEWRRAAHWTAEGLAAEWRDFRLDTEDTVTRLEFPRGNEAADRLLLEPYRVLHSGSAFDADRSPGRLERLAFHALTGPTRETRWISQSRREEESPGASYSAVHEVVHFGR